MKKIIKAKKKTPKKQTKTQKTNKQKKPLNTNSDILILSIAYMENKLWNVIKAQVNQLFTG